MNQRTFDPINLFQLQLQLERKGLDDQRLIRVPGDEPDRIPRVLVAALSLDFYMYFRHDLPGRMAEAIRSIDPAQAYSRPELVGKVLATSEWSYGRSFFFTAVPAKSLASGVETLGPRERTVLDQFVDQGFAALTSRRPVYAALIDGVVASACVSSREIDKAAESWVLTDPRFRRQGLARRVVSAWARDVMLAGKTAFYSTREKNLASLSVARSLGLTEWSRTLVFE